MDHLAGLGHEHIAYVGARAYGDFPARRAAYLEYMQLHDLPVPRRYEQRTTNSAAAGAEALRSLLALRPRPTAVMLATDLMAVGALYAAHQAGLTVPRELSVTGFDNLPIAGFTVPPLTTVAMPSIEMASAAVDAAITLVTQQGPLPQRDVRLFPPELVIRNSSDVPASGRGATRRMDPMSTGDGRTASTGGRSIEVQTKGATR